MRTKSAILAVANVRDGIAAPAVPAPTGLASLPSQPPRALAHESAVAAHGPPEGTAVDRAFGHALAAGFWVRNETPIAFALSGFGRKFGARGALGGGGMRVCAILVRAARVTCMAGVSISALAAFSQSLP